MTQIPEIYEIAIAATIDASLAIMKVYNEEIEIEIKSDGSPVTAADLASSKIIFERLEKTGIPIIGEEIINQDFNIRSKWKENWCVDPLDGTKMFILKNDEFSVNIAHIIEGKPAFGIITSPVEKKILIGGKGYGVHFFHFDEIQTPEKWKPIEAPTTLNDPVVVICSRSFHGSNYDFIQEMEKDLGEFEYIKKGSALKFIDLAEGRADIYPRCAPTMEWDIAAGQAILEALDGEITDLVDNDTLFYNKLSLYNPSFIAKTKACFQK